MIATAFKVGAGIAALILLQRFLGARAELARSFNVVTDAKGCGACYEWIYRADGTIGSKRVDDALCRKDGHEGLGCPGVFSESEDLGLMHELTSWSERLADGLGDAFNSARREIA